MSNKKELNKEKLCFKLILEDGTPVIINDFTVDDDNGAMSCIPSTSNGVLITDKDKEIEVAINKLLSKIIQDNKGTVKFED